MRTTNMVSDIGARAKTRAVKSRKATIGEGMRFPIR
jgi:hypothetical protein